MLTPSYSELMDVIRESEKLDKRVTSRYTVVLAAAKRARQLTDGANPLTYAPTDRAVSIAVKEMHEGKLRIKIDSSLIDAEGHSLVKKDPFRYRTALSKDDLREELKQDYAPTTYADDMDDDSYEPFAPEAEIIEEKPDDDLDLYADDDLIDEEAVGEIDDEAIESE